MSRGRKPTKAKGKARPTGGKTPQRDVSRQRALEKRLAEALAQQTATAEILRVIRRSPTDAQPVFDTIAERAMQLCGALHAGVLRFDGELLHVGAHVYVSPQFSDSLHSLYPRPPGRGTAAARAILTRATVHIPDLERDPDYEFTDSARAAGFRNALAVPMLQDGRAIGAIVVFGGKAGPFSEQQVEVLQTFADQAVIAVENVRVFQELGAKNKDLTEALEQRTATGEILRVISSSPTDTQPVFDAIAAAATTLCEAANSGVFLYDGTLIDLVAFHNWTAQDLAAVQGAFPRPPGSGSLTARAILTRAVAHTEDQAADPSLDSHLVSGEFRAVLSVPMLRDGEPIGAITVTRREPMRFSDAQIELLETFAHQAVIAIENVRLFTELGAKNRDLTEALEQQTATGEILGVISSSPTDVQPVFSAIAASATTLCAAENSGVFLFDGAMIDLAAHHHWTAADLEAIHGAFPRPPGPGSLTSRAILTRAVAHTADLGADPEYEASTIVAAGFRAVLSVPMLLDGEPIGAITVTRREPIAFTDTQIALLETFARQAVIAIENVRLFTELGARNHELTEALDQQMATGEILRVISRSPTDVQPVFDTIARNAVRLCDGLFGGVGTYDGDAIHAVALYNYTPDALAAVGRMYPMPPNRQQLWGRAVLSRAVVHVPDLLDDPEYRPDIALAGGWRAGIAVPMLREEQPIGAILVGRAEPGLFSERQVALLETFADQAVIAIENARLFTELSTRNRDLSESLDQQTATSEILRVISSSPTDVQPVFDTIAQSAARLCESERCFVFRYDGRVIHFTAHHGLAPEGIAAVHRNWPAEPNRGSAAGRAVLDRGVAHIPDAREDAEYALGALAAAADFRSMIAVPMLRDSLPIGVISVLRSRPGRFSDRQIALLQTFADQAVIAIENVRLFQELETRNGELLETLERQTATSEILRVISSSLTDVRPVLDAVTENAARLCDAQDVSILEADRETFRVAAFRGANEMTHFEGTPMNRDSVAGRVMLDGRLIHVHDVTGEAGDEYPVTKAFAQHVGHRTVLAAPLLREGAPIGTIFLRRTEVRPFTDKQIALLQTFADQAVIAIENVRLFTELEARNRDLTETLEQQTATSEILRVISSSPTDVQPVFDTIAESARRLCGADSGSVFTYDGALVRLDSVKNTNREQATALRRAYPMPATRGHATGRAILSGRPVHIPDVSQDPEYALGALRDSAGLRSLLSVPMVRDGVAIGAITVQKWVTARPFPDKQIALLQTFADQAVIAVENVRLFKELEARNRDLVESLDQQTATSEILRVISSSPTDIQPVLDAVARNTMRFCGAYDATIFRRDGDWLRLAAHAGPIPVGAIGEFGLRISTQTVGGRSILEGRTVHVGDLQAAVDEFPEGVENARRFGFRTILSVPLLREGVAAGVIQLRRLEAEPFSDSQIKLLQTFADQAVIAIENVRLFTELETRNRDLTETLEQQTATSEILRVISSSPTDVQPVFDTIVQNARGLCGADSAGVLTYDGELIRIEQLDNTNSEQARALQQAYPMPANQGHATGRAILTGRPVHIPDVREDPEYALDALRDAIGLRSLLSVPMLRDGVAVGAITVQKWVTARPFTDKQIALLKTFADQAVIAIENVRLFKALETRNRDLTETLEQQTATGEILRVISSSPTDVQPVFDTIARSAARLCDAFDVLVLRVDGDILRLVAHDGPMPAGDIPLHRGTLGGRTVIDRRVIHIEDLQAEADEFPEGSALARERGHRTTLSVPLLREGVAIGNIQVRRNEVRPFSDQQTALLKTFADQAVIAIENVRLFQELEARTRDLTHSVSELQALSEVSQAVGSTLDLETVLATIVSRAVQLSGSDSGIVYEFEEATESFHARASDRVGADHLEAVRAAPIRLGVGAMGRAGVLREPVLIADIEEERQHVAPQVREQLIRDGMRSLLAVPLIREGRLLGGLVILRRDRGAFSSEVVATLQTFATQSVLAMHNAGLFREIQRQKQYSEALVETSPVAIVTMDLGGKVIGWNPGAERLFGYSPAEALGRDVDDLVATPEIRAEVQANVRRSLRAGRVSGISRRARKDGTLVDVEISAGPVVVDGAEVGLIATYHDITELLRARREAETANEAKSAFLATMSHEIRTPMNAVIGMSGLLLNTPLTDEQREYTEVVRQSGDALLTVINDILDFSKIEAGKLELESQPFDLRECVESGLDLVATRAAEKGLDLAYLIAEGTPPAVVGDVTRLRQVLLNLLSNAVKFTDHGEVVLSVSARPVPGAESLQELTFSVRDTGIGIPPERVGRLFQSFSQVDASTTRRYGGTGLGLAISQRLTELMGGRIGVTSEVGVGSEFRFTIRAAAAVVPVLTRRDLSGVQPSLRGKRVLVVDDNATNRRILTAHFDAWGMASRATESPVEALEWIRTGEAFDVGILDMHMPEMDGVALARAMRGHPAGESLPLVLFTSLGRREARAESEGFAAYLHKPIKPSQLFDALVSVLADRPVHVEARGVARSELDPDMAGRHPLRILLAEDNVTNQKVALRILAQMGYRADVASNGLEAIEAVDRQTYDVILMDVQMPELDGFEASREINQRWPAGHRPRIVAMTANAMQGDRELCAAAGMDDYVAKPIRVEELVGALERCERRADVAARGASRAVAIDRADGPASPAPSAPDVAAPPAGAGEAAAAVDPAVIERLTATMGGAFIAELIDTFTEDARDQIAALRAALAASDLDAFRRAAHSLKSISETLGATELGAMARELETMARAGSLGGAGDRLPPLARAYEKAARALEEVRRGASA